MPRDMFGDVVDPSIKVGSQKWYTVPLSILAHVALFAAVIIIPLMATDVLPTPPSMMAFVGAPPPPPPPRRRRRPPAAPQPKAPTPVANPNAAPIEAPKEIVPETPSVRACRKGVPGGVEGGVPGGVMGGVVGGLAGSAAAATAAAPGAGPRRRQRSSSRPRPKNVPPVYPPIAQSARVQGVVIIEATIGADGKVKDAKVLRSIPLLDQAALDAVKQWVFTPTLLNNVPVPVIMTVTVNFTLQ